MQNFNTKYIIWTSRTQTLFLQVKLHSNVNTSIKLHTGICSFLFIVAHHTRYLLWHTTHGIYCGTPHTVSSFQKGRLTIRFFTIIQVPPNETIRCRNPKIPQPSKSADFIRQMFGAFIPKWHPLSDDLNQYENRKLFQNSGINSSFRYSRKQQNGQIGCEWNVTGRSQLAFIQYPFLAVYKYTVCSNGVQCTSVSFVRRAGNQLSCQFSRVILRTGLTNLSAMWGHSPFLAFVTFRL
jgi:hypothetical protein